MGIGRRTIPRVIVHLDMDAFFAAVEVRDNPELKGLPLIIGHRGRRGVVATCSYEARGFGVRSAMPSVTARRLCPQATWLPGRMGVYRRESRRIRAILSTVSPLVEPISIDEAFIDLSGIARDLKDGAARATELKNTIRERLGLTASVGIASNKFLAKIASDMRKPDGTMLLPHRRLKELFHPLPIERLWGVGPRTAERLHGGGVRSIGHVLTIRDEELVRLVGERGAADLRKLARGEDDRPVVSGRLVKSISEERTYGEDLTDTDEIDRALLSRAVGLARQLRRKGLVARSVHLKVRRGDYTTWTRSGTLSAPTDLAEPIVDMARRLMRERIALGSHGVRLLGVGVSALTRSGSGQAEMFEDARIRRGRRLAAAADAIRDRMGEQLVTRARLLKRKDRDEDDGEADRLPQGTDLA